MNGPLLVEVLSGPFLLTFVAEIVVLAVILGGRRRERRLAAEKGPFRLKALHREEASRWWVLPVYVWGFEAACHTGTTLMGGYGLVSLPFSYYVLLLYQLFLALGLLTVLQTLLVMLVGGSALTLGVEGRSKLPAVVAVLTPTVIVLLYLGVSRWFQKAANGAI